MNHKLTDREVKQNIYEHTNGLLYQHRSGAMELIIEEIPDSMLGYGEHHASHNNLKITLTPATNPDEVLSILLPESERQRLKDKLGGV